MLNKEIHITTHGITPGDVHFSLGSKSDLLTATGDDLSNKVDPNSPVPHTLGLGSA